MPAEAWRALIRVALDEREEAFAARLTTQLGAGERSCLAVAMSRSGVLTSDDLLARRWAREHGVEVTGMVGILMACVRRGYLTLEKATASLTAMIAAGYRSPVERLDDLLRADR